MNPYAPPTARVSDPPHDGRPSPWVTQLLALFFAFLAIFSLQNLLFRPTPLSIAVNIAVACLCGSASLGLWREKPWSRWVVYLISAFVCAFVAWVAFGGWPYASTTRSLAALLPFSLLVLFGVAAPVYVQRIFRK